MQSYGGYLPIEISGKEYFDNIEKKYILRLNSARYAIIVAANMLKIKRVYLPYYLCDSVEKAIKKYSNLSISYYNINNKFEPAIESISNDSCIIITNYYGQKDDEFYKKMLSLYDKVVFDNTQCFFQKPYILDNVYNVYSPRKFFGVSDGGYLIGKNLDSLSFPIDLSSNRCSYLLKTLEVNVSECYKDYLIAEDTISNSGIKEMSILTKKLLSNIDYKMIQLKRSKNYNYYLDVFKDVNELSVSNIATSPIVYPLLIKSEYLRKKLIENCIYVSQWWKSVLEHSNSNSFEQYISNYLLPIPIDQRYCIDDLEYVAKFIKSHI